MNNNLQLDVSSIYIKYDLTATCPSSTRSHYSANKTLSKLLCIISFYIIHVQHIAESSALHVSLYIYIYIYMTIRNNEFSSYSRFLKDHLIAAVALN